MEQSNDGMELLSMIERPAFCIKDGIVVRVNQAAQQRMVEPGANISELLVTGQQEYADLQGGSLYLSVSISGRIYGASVTRMNGFDIFRLEQDMDQPELQAMALAAMELRSPLAGIMTISDKLFPALAASGDPAAQEQVARMNRCLFQMLRMVSNMSDAARYSASGTASQETRDICAILEEIFDKAAVLVEQAGLRLQFTNLQSRIYCLVDAQLLERAIYNILSNAMKFAPQGSTIKAKLRRRENKLYLTVQDSGQGIPDALRGSVYSRYQRAPAIEDGQFGIGLGMVLIFAAAVQHGGTVLMEQPEGAGTRITMTLEIRQRQKDVTRSPIFQVDYAGGLDHSLIELSDVLPTALYKKERAN